MIKKLSYILFLFLFSCRVGEDYTSQPFIDDAQVQNILRLKPQQKDDCHYWYEIFNDNDLNTLLTFANTNNLSLKQGRERLIQSRYALQINSYQSLPMIDAIGNYTFSKINNSQQIALNNNVFKIGFDAAWELDIWGKSQYISEQYLELMNKAQYSLYNLQITLSAELVADYMNLKKNLELYRITQQNIQLQTEILQTVKTKYTLGLADDLALSQAQQTLTQTEAELPALEIQIEKYKNALSVLLGTTPNNLPVNFHKQGYNIVAQPFKYSVTKLYNLPLDVIRTRPDIMATEANLRQQNAVVNEAIAALYPNINLSASFAYIASSGRRLIKNDNQYYSYSPNLLQPIWHWKQLKNNIELQRHIKDEYLLQYNEAFLTALIEVKNAIYSVEKAYKRNEQLRKSLSEVKKIMELTYEKYNAGLIDFIEVAISQQNFLAAQNNVINNNADILLSIISFYKAIGNYSI